MTTARELLERLKEYGWLEMLEEVNPERDDAQLAEDIDAFLGQPEEAREAVLLDVLVPLLQSFDAWCRLDHHGICQSHLNVKPCSVARARRAFKGTSPAAAALLAQGEARRHIFVTAEERLAQFPADGYWLSVRDTAALALASPTQGEKE